VSWAGGAVAAPGGGAYVALRDDDSTTYRLAGVTPDGAVSAVQIPAMEDPDLFVLDDGRVVLAGRFRAADEGGIGDDPDYGFQVVDPATGQGRHTFVPGSPGLVDHDYEHAALSADGRTLFLFLSWSPFPNEHDDDPPDVTRLYAFDVSTGHVRARRDLAGDLSAISVYDSGVYAPGLLARPDGGVTLVFDATPSASDDEKTIPTVLFYGADLQPDGNPVRLASLDHPANTDAIAGTPDGTVFAELESGDGVSVVAVPDGGGSGTQLAALPDASSGYGLSVEPAQVQALVYTDGTIRPLDLTTGTAGDPLALDCTGQGVRDLYPGRDRVGALMLGECDTPSPRTQYLWVVTG